MKHLVKCIFATILFSLTLSTPFSALALEVKGVKVDETAQVGGSALVLNGAGVRTKLMFNRDFPLVPNFQWKPLEQHIDLIGI